MIDDDYYPGPMGEIGAAKRQVRGRVRDARRALGAEARRRLGDALARVLEEHVPAGSRVAAYLPMPEEPDVRPFLAHHLARGGEVALPRVAETAEPQLEWVDWTLEAPTRRHPVLPLDEPEGPGREIERLLDQGPLLMLLPALAVDTRGHRLGQGGGYYDRLFARLDAAGRLTDVAAWAVVGPGEVLPPGTFPVEAHDLQVEAVVTPERLRRLVL
ncbi:hypothetical protein GCM10009674_28580 [Nesterenkonia xinjiangensis]